MRAVLIAALAGVLSACGPSPSHRSDAEPSEAEFEAARAEAAHLISGMVLDWRSASEQGRRAYAMASVRAMNPAAADDPSAVRLFISCVDHLAETSASDEYLADLSRNCAEAL